MRNQITIDTKCDSVQHLIKKDKRLAKLISIVGPISYSPHDENTYAFIIHEIIEQMLSIKAGQNIFARLEVLCNGIVTPEAVNALSDDELKSIGTSYAKVGYIRNITNAILSKTLDIVQLNDLPDDKVIKELTSIKGIGTWTAKMYLIFVLDRPDVLPLEDGAFLQAYRWLYKTNDCSPKVIKAKCKKWSPYSSIAARYLYRALDSGLTKSSINL